VRSIDDLTLRSFVRFDNAEDGVLALIRRARRLSASNPAQLPNIP
jgi:hypothetical protein